MNPDSSAIVYQAITQGLIIGFCTAAMIGPVNFMAVRRGILHGFQHTFLVGLGAALIDAACAYLVFAGLLHVGFHGIGKIILWGAGAVLILFLTHSVLSEIREDPENGYGVKLKKQIQIMDNPLVIGILIAGSNPFTLFHWIGMVAMLKLSGSIDPSGRAATSFFSAVLISEMVWFSLLGWGVHHSRNLFNRKLLSRVSWGSAILLVGYGIFMAGKILVTLYETGGAPFVTK